MKKKIFSLGIAVIFIVLCLSGCGNNRNYDNTTNICWMTVECEKCGNPVIIGAPDGDTIDRCIDLFEVVDVTCGNCPSN